MRAQESHDVWVYGSAQLRQGYSATTDGCGRQASLESVWSGSGGGETDTITQLKLRGLDRIELVVSLLRTMKKAGCPTLPAMDMAARVAVVDCLSSGLVMRDGLSGFPLEAFREVCFASGFFGSGPFACADARQGCSNPEHQQILARSSDLT